LLLGSDEENIAPLCFDPGSIACLGAVHFTVLNQGRIYATFTKVVVLHKKSVHAFFWCRVLAAT